MAHFSSLQKICFLLIITIGLSVPAVILAAAPVEQGSSTNELIEKAPVYSVSAADQLLVLRKKGGKNLQIVIDPQTVFVGFSNLKELQPKDRVKVWYREDSTQKTATKIEKLPELGC